jgi:hypothetical protein
MAVPHSAGFVFHYHHLIWFTALLAASPSGDALSIDSWYRAKKIAAPPPDAAYAIPIRTAWLLIGFIFFFPGYWKLAESGIEWIWSDNLRNHMYAKWIQFEGFEPLFRIDRHPLLLRTGALFTVVFELAFVFLVFWKRTRWIAVLAALLFHAATRAFMALDYSVLYPCYVVFFDFRPLLSRFIPEQDAEPRRAWPAIAVSSILVVGAFTAGALNDSRGWPFACYPTFQWIAKAEMPTLSIQLVREDGSTIEVPGTLLDNSQRGWAQRWSLAGVLGPTPAKERLAEYWQQIQRKPEISALARDPMRIRFYRAYVSTIPEDQQAVLRRTLLAEL